MINSYIALGYKCNHNCLNCPLSTYDRLHGQLDPNVIKKNIAALSSYTNNLHITISGGEPTLNGEMLEYFIDKIIEKDITAGARQITQYTLTVVIDEKEIDISVSNDVYYEKNIGDYIYIDYNQGALGFAYYEYSNLNNQ